MALQQQATGGRRLGGLEGGDAAIVRELRRQGQQQTVQDTESRCLPFLRHGRVFPVLLS